MSYFEDEERMHPCIVCGKPATRFGIYTGRSWFDRIPLLSWVRKLQSIPCGYAVKERSQGAKKYCETCRCAAETVLDKAHAEMRAAHAAFNSEQQQKISWLDHGGLDQQLHTKFTNILGSLDLLERGVIQNQPKQLDAPVVTGTIHVMPVSSTGNEGS
jgi:hypothetical protein